MSKHLLDSSTKDKPPHLIGNSINFNVPNQHDNHANPNQHHPTKQNQPQLNVPNYTGQSNPPNHLIDNQQSSHLITPKAIDKECGPPNKTQQDHFRNGGSPSPNKMFVPPSPCYHMYLSVQVLMILQHSNVISR
jgi:hypothetical protein